MASYYSVVQYLPDPITDERINVGVIAFDEIRLRSRFIGDWARAQRFGGQDVGFLRQFAEEVQDSAQSGQLKWTFGAEGRPKAVTPALLSKAAVEWTNSIQLTDPRASLLDVDSVLGDAASRFLRLRSVRPKHYRDRRDAVKIVRDQMRRAVERTALHVGIEIKCDLVVRGKYDQHRFDVGVTKGNTLLVAEAISFESPASKWLMKEVDAIKWAIADVQRLDSELPLAVLTLAPKRRSKDFEHVRKVFKGLGASVLQEGQMEDWTARQLKAR